MEEPNYICIKGGTYCGRADNGKPTEMFISGGGKVHLDFNLGFISMNYGDPCELRPHYVSKDTQCDKFCACTVENRGHIYLPQENIFNLFRPIIHKHLAAKLCKNVDDLNEFLKTLPINSLKDVKDCKTSWLVIYVDKGDDK